MPDPKKRRVMLISNSFCHGRGYLEHCAEVIKTFLGPIKTLVFVPFASKDWGGYTELARNTFGRMGIQVTGIHQGGNPRENVRSAEAIFIGGGNTFRLLRNLFVHRVVVDICDRVCDGYPNIPYIGASAGANVAGPTIKTTNDMPIIDPQGFEALNLVPFQINPHYIDTDPTSTHMGETRDKRIAEFHEVEGNDAMVVGMREGSWVTVENGIATLHGTTGAKLFRKGQAPCEWEEGPTTLWP